jgi:hypothetical protein
VSTAGVLEDARRAGVELVVTHRGTIRWRCAGPLPEDLRGDLIAHKAEIVTLLRQAVSWDQTTAELLLANVKHEVDRIRTGYGGRPPAPLARLLEDAIVIGERYIRDYEIEAARGWDALELLRDLVPHVRDLAARWQRTHTRTEVIGGGTDGPARGR